MKGSSGEGTNVSERTTQMQVQTERMQHVDPANVERAMRAMFGLSGYEARCGLEPSLLELVKIRASQINGCANCLDMHTKDARARGESEQRLYLLAAWRESPCYSERERAALAWTEAVNRLSEGADHRSACEILDQHFSETEQMNL